MNTIIETIAARRSVRKYTGQPVPKRLLEQIVEAGRQAPSAHNAQNLHFTVITDKKRIDELNDKSKSAMANGPLDWAKGMAANDAFHIFYNAPAIIVVSSGEHCLLPGEDTSAAVENMLIAATSLNLGSCWIGLANFHFSTLSGFSDWGIPAGYKPLQTICLGYPDGDAPKAPRKPASVNWL